MFTITSVKWVNWMGQGSSIWCICSKLCISSFLRNIVVVVLVLIKKDLGNFFSSLWYNKASAQLKKIIKHGTTECVMDLDLESEMIIVKSNMTTLNWASIFKAAGAVVKIGSSLKPTHHKKI